MNEIESKAAEAWTALVSHRDDEQKPIEPGVAIDMVQDVTGDRDDAVTALVSAAADWLNTLRIGAVLRGISADGSEAHVGNVQDAELVADYLRGETLGLATVHLSHIHERSRDARSQFRSEARACEWWMGWERSAELAIRIVRELSEAAYPA